MRILVAGGAGYIGSHAVRYLKKTGHDVWVYDNLGVGHKAAVANEKLIVGDLADRAKLTAALKDNGIEAVMHFAAFALVGESVTDPAKYYLNNVCATIEVLEAMRAANVKKLVFSSTTATYGTPEKMPIAESTPQKPINPYGFSKLVIERAMDDYAARLRPRRRGPPLLQRRRRHRIRRHRRGPSPGIAPDPDRAASRQRAAQGDHNFRE